MNIIYTAFNIFQLTTVPKKSKRKPRTDNSEKYKNTVIYEIRSISYPEIFYIGHTICAETRFSQHKKEAEDTKSIHLKSRYMRLIGVENFKFKILLKFSCKSRAEAEIVERRYITRLKPPMNTALVTPKQKKINEDKYITFSGKIEFSTLYTFGKSLLYALNII